MSSYTDIKFHGNEWSRRWNFRERYYLMLILFFFIFFHFFLDQNFNYCIQIEWFIRRTHSCIRVAAINPKCKYNNYQLMHNDFRPVHLFIYVAIKYFLFRIFIVYIYWTVLIHCIDVSDDCLVYWILNYLFSLIT